MDASQSGVPAERGDGFSQDRKRLFLLALRNGESVLGACALVGISNRTAYNHRSRDPEFAREWRLARQMMSFPAELLAYERAVGVEEQVYAYGKPTHVRTRSSDMLLAKLLIAENPQKYGRAAGLAAERQRIERRIERKVAKLVRRLIAEPSAERP